MDRPDFAAALVEAAPDGILTVDGEGLIVTANTSTERMFGYEPGELVGKPVELLVPERSRSRHVGDVAAYLASPHVREMGANQELRGRRKNGSVFPVEIMLSPLAGRERVRAVAVVRDVTRRHAAEEQARLWRTVVDASKVGVVLIASESAVIEACNPAFAELHGRTVDELVGQSVLITIPAEQRDDVARWLDNLGDATHAVYQRERVRKDGSTFLSSVDATFEPSPTGGRPRIIAYVQDVTEHLHDEAERARLHHESQVALAAREELVAIASHDIRSPLSGIQLQLQNVARGLGRIEGPDVARLRARVGEIHEGLDHVFGLLDSLLARQHREAAVLEFRRTEVDLAAVVRRIADRMAPQFAQLETRLVVDADAPVPAFCDRLRVDQAVSNILGNALRYSAGAEVAIEVSSVADGARVAVQDRGPGIDPRVLPVLFERGFGDGHVGHYGLGLWIAKRIVDAHDGRILVDTTPGHGTTLTIVLPTRPPMSA